MSIIFPVGSVTGERICVDIRIFYNHVFTKTRHFKVHIVILEPSPGIIVHVGWVWVSIFNTDCEFMNP